MKPSKKKPKSIFNVLKPMKLEDWVEKHCAHNIQVEGGGGFTFLHCPKCNETYLYSIPFHLIPKAKRKPRPKDQK